MQQIVNNTSIVSSSSIGLIYSLYSFFSETVFCQNWSSQVCCQLINTGMSTEQSQCPDVRNCDYSMKFVNISQDEWGAVELWFFIVFSTDMKMSMNSPDRKRLHVTCGARASCHSSARQTRDHIKQSGNTFFANTFHSRMTSIHTNWD